MVGWQLLVFPLQEVSEAVVVIKPSLVTVMIVVLVPMMKVSATSSARSLVGMIVVTHYLWEREFFRECKFNLSLTFQC